MLFRVISQINKDFLYIFCALKIDQTHVCSFELAAVRQHPGGPRCLRLRLRQVAQVDGEGEQGEYAQPDEEDAAFGQHQEGANVVPVADVLHFLLIVLLHQVAVLGSLWDLECILIHLHSGGEKRTKQKKTVKWVLNMEKMRAETTLEICQNAGYYYQG